LRIWCQEQGSGMENFVSRIRDKNPESATLLGSRDCPLKNPPDMLLHVVGGDEVAADIADLLELLFLVSALVDEVHVLHVHLLLLEHLLARIEAAHVVTPRVPEQQRGYHEDRCFKLNWICGSVCRLDPD
jgi:hypothetical protein